MITVQVRRYKKDGTYTRTVEFQETKYTQGLVTASLRAWLGVHSDWELEHHLQTTPCNIMVRRDGKLISYKEFM